MLRSLKGGRRPLSEGGYTGFRLQVIRGSGYRSYGVQAIETGLLGVKTRERHYDDVSVLTQKQY